MHTLPTPPHSLHLLFFVVLFSYFLPTIVAVLRLHTHAVGVFIVNLLFGWTGIGWLVAQIWSFGNDPAGVKSTRGGKLLGLLAVVYYLILFLFIFVTAHKPDAMKAHGSAAAQSSLQTTPQPQMTPVPQNGVPEPANDILGK